MKSRGNRYHKEHGKHTRKLRGCLAALLAAGIVFTSMGDGLCQVAAAAEETLASAGEEAAEAARSAADYEPETGTEKATGASLKRTAEKATSASLGEGSESDEDSDIEESGNAASPAQLDGTAESTENGYTLINDLTQASEIPAGETLAALSEDAVAFEDVRLDNGIIVSAIAEKDVFPEGTTMQVSLIDAEADKEKYDQAEAALTDHHVEYTGFIPIDISFFCDGEEVEPDGDVRVSFEMPQAVIPDDADTGSLEVRHLKEDESGEITKVEAVADTGDATEGRIRVHDTGEAADAISSDVGAEVSFRVSSFSTFTIVWNGGKNTTVSYNSVKIVDAFDNDIDAKPAAVTDNSKLYLGNNNKLIFSADTDLLKIDGYTFIRATLEQNNYTYTLTWITGNANTSNITCNYSESTRGGNNDGITLYYSKIDTDSLRIVDDIAQNGRLKVNLESGENIRYVWYQCSDIDDTEEARISESDTLTVTPDMARKYYRVERYEKDTLKAKSPVYQIPYYNELQNGSFEDPTGDHMMTQWTNGAHPELIWKTTGPGTGDHLGQDIEILNDNYSGLSEYFGVNKANQGHQFAELNCEEAGTLYQDILAEEDTKLYWGLAHCARQRQGTDSMCVIIMDAAIADKYVKDQNAVNDIIKKSKLNAGQMQTNQKSEVSKFEYTYAAGKKTSVSVWLIKDTNDGDDKDDWHDYNSNDEPYVVPEGQHLTRFMFGAVSTGSGDNTVGNLLDSITFSEEKATEAGKGHIQIEKSFNVAEVAKIAFKEKRHFEFDIYDSSGKKVTNSPITLPFDNGNWFALENVEIPKNSNFADFYIVERAEDISGYSFSGAIYSAGQGESGEGINQQDGIRFGQIRVYRDQLTKVVITNNYKKTATKSLTIKKVITGNMADTGKYFGFTLKVENCDTDIACKVISGDESKIAFPADPDNSQCYHFNLTNNASIKVDLPVGSKYTLTEDPEAGSPYTVSLKKDEAAVTEFEFAGTITENDPADTKLQFTNTYNVTIPTGIKRQVIIDGIMMILAGAFAVGWIGLRRR